MCTQRLLIVSFLALFSSPTDSESTLASSINQVVKTKSTVSNAQHEDLTQSTSRRNRSNPRVNNSPRKEDVSDAQSVKNDTTSLTLQREILALMGLRQRPRLSLNTRLHGRKMSAPLYMMDLYNSLEMNGSDSNGNFCCNNSAVMDSRAVGADTIMSYVNHVRGARPKLSRLHATFRFKIETPQGENMTAAEFRIYKEQKFNRLRIPQENVTYRVELHQVRQPGKDLERLGDLVVRHWEKGWQAFDVTTAGREWAKEPSKNFGIELSVRTLAGVEVNPFDIGFVGFHGPQEKRPFLVSFYRGDTYRRFFPNQPFPQHPSRRRRSPRSLGPQLANLGTSSKSGNHKSCSRRMLYVSFQRLGWQDWIIAPEGYSAFFCHGECSFPLSAHMNATNHAIVQTLVHLMSPSVVPQPCCSPTKLTAISVLYFDDDNNVVLKKYTNMVVKACGCH